MMKFLDNWYDRPEKKGKEKEPPKRGLARLFALVWRNLFALIQLNLQFLLFCLPVVTIPAACTALSRVTLRMVRDESCAPWPDFWQSFRSEFLRATPVGLFLLLACGAAGCGVFFFAAAEGYLWMGLCAIAFLLLTMAGFYLFPMLALLDLGAKDILKNALLMSVVCFGYNLAALGAVAALTLLLLAVFPYTVPIALFFSAAPCNLITIFAAYPGIRTYAIREA